MKTIILITLCCLIYVYADVAKDLNFEGFHSMILRHVDDCNNITTTRTRFVNYYCYPGIDLETAFEIEKSKEPHLFYKKLYKNTLSNNTRACSDPELLDKIYLAYPGGYLNTDVRFEYEKYDCDTFTYEICNRTACVYGGKTNELPSCKEAIQKGCANSAGILVPFAFIVAILSLFIV